MINFYYEFQTPVFDEKVTSKWILDTIIHEGYCAGDINFIFCSDAYLLDLNQKFLSHNTLTDIISFDYTVGNKLQGEIYISVPRVEENAKEFNEPIVKELHRVIIHGVLHYCGYKDKNKKDKNIMRNKEDFYLKALNNVPRETL